MIKTSKNLKKESPTHSKNFLEDMTELKIVLKKFSQECLKANISTQPLINALLTIYGLNQVVKGHQATIREKLLRTPILMNRREILILADLVFELIWETDSITSDFLNCAEGKFQEPALSSGINGN